jgi:hypothetical protein
MGSFRLGDGWTILDRKILSIVSLGTLQRAREAVGVGGLHNWLAESASTQLQTSQHALILLCTSSFDLQPVKSSIY